MNSNQTARSRRIDSNPEAYTKKHVDPYAEKLRDSLKLASVRDT
jgi:hypothetical protein